MPATLAISSRESSPLHPVFERVLVEVGARPSRPAEIAVALDDAVAEQVGVGAAPPTVRIWQNDYAIVFPRSHLRRLAHPYVLDHDGQRWPLCARSSGGSAVAHGPGTLNMSLILGRRGAKPELTIEAGYGLWIGILDRALSRQGLVVEAAPVPRSFCAGKFDAVISGRKVAGVAQSRRANSVLIHGTILTTVDSGDYLSAIVAAEQLLEVRSTADAYDCESIASLQELLRAHLSDVELAWELARAAAGGSSPSQLLRNVSHHERHRAEEITEQHAPRSKR